MTTLLLVFIEPTPYILSLINELIKTRVTSTITVLFLYENLTQNWSLKLPPASQVLPISFKRKWRSIWAMFCRNRFDIVHLAGWGNRWILCILFLAKLSGALVTTESDTPFPSLTKGWRRLAKRLFYPAIFKCIHLFMPGGTKQARYLQFYGVPTDRIRIVNMTVDTLAIRQYITSLRAGARDFFRDTYQIPRENVVFIFIGRLEAYKGIVTLVNLFQHTLVGKQNLLIIGDGSLRPFIENATRTNPNIIFTGRLKDTDLIDAYHAADVLVLPSHAEPWGLVVNEAMAVGLPVIASESVGCVGDLIEHLKTGFVTQTNNPEALYSAINYMINFPLHRQTMGKNSHQKIATWTIENVAQKMNLGWDKLLCT